MKRKIERTDKEYRQTFVQRPTENRKVLLGGLTLMLLAASALAIRSLFPDLNPYVLAGLGAAVYVAYLGAALQAESARQQEEIDRAEAARAVVPVEVPGEERL